MREGKMKGVEELRDVGAVLGVCKSECVLLESSAEAFLI